MKTRSILIAGVLLLLAGAAAWFYFSGKETARIEVETVPVETGQVTTTVTATGTTEPITVVAVGTQVSGVVEKIYVDYNSIVKKGQLIAELDKTNLLAALTQARALYSNALNERRYQQSLYDRQKQLYDKALITQAEYDLALYNLNNAKGNVIQRKSELDRARTNLSYANIYSPISGVVLSKDVDKGQTVAASLNTPTLFTIAQDLKEMQVEADVDEADIGQVRDGQRVAFTVDAYQGEEFSGAVTQVRLNPTTTANVVTYTVVVQADNPDLKLKPGMTATITIYTRELKGVMTIEAKAANFLADEALLAEYARQRHQSVPETGSRPGSSRQIVYVLDKEVIVPRPVRLGLNDGIRVQVLEGLELGEEIIFNFQETTDGKTAGSSRSPFLPVPPGRRR